MEQVYSVTCASSSCSKRLNDWLCDRHSVCSLSNKNLLAFTSFTDLSDSEPKYFLVHVYVVDLNLPHEPYLVTRHEEDVTTLEWDISGTRLMIGDAFGRIEIWSVRDFLINEWYLISSFNAFEGERVLSGLWFHNGVKAVIAADKKDASHLYCEKFVNAKFTASVRQFGGKPANGCIAVSNTGLVWCVIYLSDNSVITGTKILANFRSKLKVVDMCYTRNGEFLVITSNGAVDSSINCYRVTIKLSNITIGGDKAKCVITSQPFSSFYLNLSHDSTYSNGYPYVNNLKFILKEAAEAVVVGASGPLGSSVELWELRERPIQLHKIFQQTKNNSNNNSNNSNSEFNSNQGGGGGTNQPKTTVWQYQASANYYQSILTIATPRVCLYDLNPPLSYIMVSYKDNTIKCYYRENLQSIFAISLNSTSMKNNPSNKFGLVNVKSTSTPAISNIVDMQFSWSGSALVLLDAASQLFVYRVPPVTDPKTTFNPVFLQTMLEYCLVSGNDWWDLLICLRPTVIDTLCDMLTEGFMQKQSLALQQKYYSRFLSIKASLYRCLNQGNAGTSGQNKSGDCYTLLMLNAISNLLKSLLRPSVNQDKEGPAEMLSNLIQTKGNEPHYFNVDKILICLEHKDFYVETSILQSLQHLNQWIGDLALYLLASLPQQFHNHFRFPGGGLIYDVKSLNTLRELLVIIRIWGLIKESCLPDFTILTKDLDVIALIFKLLSRTVASMGTEPDEGFLDECCSLPNQVLITQLDLALKARGVASPALFINNSPLQFQYFQEAPFFKYHIKTHTVDGAVDCNKNTKIDAVRHIALGPKDAAAGNVRLCTRCSAVSLIQTQYKSPSTRAWDIRWCSNCICGGHWKAGS